jgi:zinc D-Ala-D-Ala dipeptidase
MCHDTAGRAGRGMVVRSLAAVAATLAISSATVQAQSAMPANFVYLRDIDPTIAQDMRYAGADNLVGRPITGYDAPECILRRDVADALRRVQAELAASGLGLKVYDCYRPQRAVRAMAQWSQDGRPVGSSKRYFPNLHKANLFAFGYLASVSRHSSGTAIDLTLVQAARTSAAPFDPAASYGPCTAPATQRSPDDSIDMGTGYDCLDVNSHTRSPAVAPEQRRWRTTLVAAMAKHGFANYHKEWWHFSYGPANAPHYDFPIRPRRSASAP